MPVYQYMAIDANGQSATGTLTAPSRVSALGDIARRGLTPIRLEEGAEGKAPKPAPAGRRGRVPQAAAEAFTRELSNLLAGGVPLARALHILGREASNPAARKQWESLHEDVVGGVSLADAMAKFPQSFPPVHVAMVRAGETGGFLDTVLAQIADFRARERDLKGRVRSAMIYPVVLAVLAVGVLTFLLTYFIPRFTGVFADFGAALPALTRGIVAVSHFVTSYGLWLLAAGAVAVVLLRRAVRSEAGRRTMEKSLLHVPGVGAVLARFALVRFCRMLGTLLGAGVPMVTALKVAREALGNQTLADAVGSSIEEVQRGAALSRSLAACPQLFPPSVAEIIAVAEESSRLDQELIRLAAANETELDRRLRVLVALAEPAMLFVMAALVGTIVIGMLLPVFTLQEFIH